MKESVITRINNIRFKIDYSVEWNTLDHEMTFEIDAVSIATPVGWRELDWENDQYLPEFKGITDGHLNRIVAKDIVSNVA